MKLQPTLSRRTLLARGALALGPQLRCQCFDSRAQVSAPSWRRSAPTCPRPRCALPPEVVEHAKHHILDTFAAMVSGSSCRRAARRSRLRTREAGRPASPSSARTCSRGRWRPRSSTACSRTRTRQMIRTARRSRIRARRSCRPRSLLGEIAWRRAARSYLRAVVLGYDVGTRLTMALGGVAFRDETRRSTHAFAGTFGSRPRPACVAALSAEQMRWLLDYASQQAAGYAVWGRDTDHIEKAFVFGGMPARNGVTAALLVRAGWNGVDDVFSGEDNFFAVNAPKGDPPSSSRARRALRNREHRHQEVDRGHADPGAARCDRELARTAPV